MPCSKGRLQLQWFVSASHWPVPSAPIFNDSFCTIRGVDLKPRREEMVSYPEFVRFCRGRACEKGGLYAIQPNGLAGTPIKIGYAFDVLQRLAMWHYAYPHGINILAVARTNRPNDTHFGKRRALQLAERALKHELRDYVVARDEWMHLLRNRRRGASRPV